MTDNVIARLALAHEREIRELRQAQDVDFVLVSTEAKRGVQRAVVEAEPGPGVRTVAFRATLAALSSDGGDSGPPGTGRLSAASDKDLLELLLRFRPRHKEPIADRPWAWTATLALTARPTLREALADLAASGGNEAVLLRRPQIRMGPLATALANVVYPDGKGGGKGTGKGKGKGKPPGKAQGGGADGGRGPGRGGGRGGKAPAPALLAGDEDAPGSGSGGTVPMEASYTGDRLAPPPAKKARPPTPDRPNR